MSKRKQLEFPSELRFDLVSEDWVVVASGRAQRPEMFKKEKKENNNSQKKDCPFCQKEIIKNAVLVYPKNLKDSSLWTTIIIPNKYPAFIPSKSLNKKTEGGIYQKMNAVGWHELVVMRDHNKSLALLEEEKIKEVFDAYQERYLELKERPYVNHIAIFHNHGPEAGASQPHPHSQIITTPLIDVDLRKALIIAENYYKENKKCIYCKMNEWDMKVKSRIVAENIDFLAVCPFASKSAFQVIITPKKHLPYFEEINESQKINLAQIFKKVLFKLYKGLNNPDYNFYLHTSPSDLLQKGLNLFLLENLPFLHNH
jgi:UDPglucose--hexose-1-phosphate uridylyltransferase